MHVQGMLSTPAQVKDRFDEWSGCEAVFDHSGFLPVFNHGIQRIAFTGLHEAEMANTSLRYSDQALTERRSMQTVTNGQACTAALVFTGSHCFGLAEQVLQTAQT